MAELRGLQDLQPTQTKNLYTGNYIDFLNDDFNQWTQQFLPEVYDQEINIYGNRTLSGFLKMISAEEATTSDQIIWTEQGRLHTRYTGCFVDSSDTQFANDTAIGASTAFTDNDGFLKVTVPTSQEGGNIDSLAYRIGQTVMVQRQGSATDLKGAAGAPLLKGIITHLDDSTRTFRVTLYNAGSVAASGTGTSDVYTTLVYGSEYAKGTNGMTGTVFPTYKTYQNSPIIMKDHFALNGSDTSQVGWIEVESENGASGYLWYVKAEHENRLRWEDYMELSMLESVVIDSNQTTAVAAGDQSAHSTNQSSNSLRGTEGFFQSLERRGNVWEGLSNDMQSFNTVGSSADGLPLAAHVAYGASGSTTDVNTGIYAFDEILKIMDKNAAVEENMLYLDRTTSLRFDDMLSNLNTAGNATGTSWGVFNNSKDMALNLGFTGFRRGSYDFYKTDWKYLNDWSGRGGFGDLEGILVPAGTSTVYDEMAGGNVKRPFCHIRYRASEADNRKMKSWITGSVGGAYTSDVDEIRMHYLTERCIITQAANNFFLLKGEGQTALSYDAGDASGFNYQLDGTDEPVQPEGISY